MATNGENLRDMASELRKLRELAADLRSDAQRRMDEADEAEAILDEAEEDIRAALDESWETFLDEHPELQDVDEGDSDAC